jgi:hypothetical protein
LLIILPQKIESPKNNHCPREAQATKILASKVLLGFPYDTNSNLPAIPEGAAGTFQWQEPA